MCKKQLKKINIKIKNIFIIICASNIELANDINNKIRCLAETCNIKVLYRDEIEQIIKNSDMDLKNIKTNNLKKDTDN